jgi:signal transduction histidine kinase
LDIKLKSNRKNRIIGFLISVLGITVVAVSVILTYQPILNIAQRYRRAEQQAEKNYYKEGFLTLLEQSNYALYWDLLSTENNSLQLPSDLYLPKELKELSVSDDQYSIKLYFQNLFNNTIQNWYSNFYLDMIHNYPMLEYYIMDQRYERGRSLTNSIHSIEMLLLTTEDGRQMKEKYPFYLILSYDRDGAIKILDFKGYSKEQLDTLLSRQRSMSVLKEKMQEEIDYSYLYQYVSRVKPPSEVTIIYASQSEDFYLRKGTATEMLNISVWDFNRYGFMYVATLAAILVGLLALLLPLIKPLSIGEGFAGRLPFELALAGVGFVCRIYNRLTVMAWETASDLLITVPRNLILSEKSLRIINYGLNLLALIILASILYAAVLSVRRVFIIGFKRYVKEQTILGGLFRIIKNAYKKLYYGLKDIDFKDISNRTIIRLLAANFLILAILCSTWFIGIILLIPYSILLFYYIRKYLDDIKRKYSILLSTAGKMANGNLDADIEEELGIFESLKKEFEKIQLGFRRAVEEEMKSQRMKTELITNVSHDLKTPLTAIITYVDLLKNESCSPEERASYIHTLDKKSQRLKLLIEDLFEVSKANSNSVTLYLTEIDLIYLMKQVILENEDMLNQAGIELRWKLPEDKVILSLDIEKTHRIFENLIINIAKYAMPNSRAYIEVITQEERVMVVLKNISASELKFHPEEITERFVRGDKARNTEGSGLGLAIVKSFVELQNGSFEIMVDGDLFKAVISWRRA